MSAERVLRTTLGCLLIGACSAVNAAEEEQAPDAEFLEYLGMWEESDEEWLLLEDAVADIPEERNDPVPESEESTETQDES